MGSGRRMRMVSDHVDARCCPCSLYILSRISAELSRSLASCDASSSSSSPESFALFYSSMARMGAESSVSRRFVQDVPAGAVHHHQVIPGSGMINPSMGALLAGFGMAPAGIFLPGRRPLVSAVYGAGGATTVWNNGVAMAGQDHTGGGGHGERALAPMHRGPWTAEEDE
jgi:hypothetical protein